MKMIQRSFVFSLAALLVLVSFGCRTKTTKNTPPRTTTMSTDTVGDVSMTTPTETVARVESPEDFVREDSVATEQLTGDINLINERAQAEGWIRDAFFEYDASTLSPDAQDALTTSANWLRTHPEFSLVIEGHTDERGTEQYNLALGERRANTAKDYMTTLGIDSSRIRTLSYGEERPFQRGSDDASWRQNRRAHLVLQRR
jgi:peptidoglycan-associated lipoprotein